MRNFSYSVILAIAAAQPLFASSICERPNAYLYSLCPDSEMPLLRSAREAWENGEQGRALQNYEAAMADANAKGRFTRTDLERIAESWSAGLGEGTPDKLLMLRRQIDPMSAARMLVNKEAPLRKDESYLELLALIYNDSSDKVTDEQRIAAMKMAVTIYRSDPSKFFTHKWTYTDLLEALAEKGQHEYGLLLFSEVGEAKYEYVALAADAGLAAAQYIVGGRMAERADLAVKKESWEDALELSLAAQAWFEKAAAQGYQNAAEIAQINTTRIGQLKHNAAIIIKRREAEQARRDAAAAERANAEPLPLTRKDLQKALQGWHGDTVKRQMRAILSSGGAWHPAMIQCGPYRCRYFTVEMWIELRGKPSCDANGSTAWCNFDYSLRVENLVAHAANPYFNAIGASQIYNGSARLHHNGTEWRYAGR